MKKNKKVIYILTIINIIITLISARFDYVILIFIWFKYHIFANEASSIGIIGGADGPTSIYIASKPSLNPYLITIIFAILSILGIIYLIFNKNKPKA